MERKEQEGTLAFLALVLALVPGMEPPPKKMKRKKNSEIERKQIAMSQELSIVHRSPPWMAVVSESVTHAWQYYIFFS